MEPETKDLLISKIQAYRRKANTDLLRALDEEDDPKNLEDLVRLVGNLNAALEHLTPSDSATARFCVLKHLSTALIQSTEFYEESSAVAEMIAILSNNKIMPCSSCEDDMEKGEYNGIQTIT